MGPKITEDVTIIVLELFQDLTAKGLILTTAVIVCLSAGTEWSFLLRKFVMMGTDLMELDVLLIVWGMKRNGSVRLRG